MSDERRVNLSLPRYLRWRPSAGSIAELATAYIASQEDPKRLALLAKRMGQTEDETYCGASRSAKRSRYCQCCALA